MLIVLKHSRTDTTRRRSHLSEVRTYVTINKSQDFCTYNKLPAQEKGATHYPPRKSQSHHPCHSPFPLFSCQTFQLRFQRPVDKIDLVSVQLIK
ncbi:hypothetical protein K2173_025066 [Erythroxylum novogranatense]|uniref:Uncharacterized protein n=1 Tax=Erythroxylum novogranatense TaxID=1862640 RepID=A0AAV8SWN5_9ROSI|nr:hypothetical protein K2173_025066 [Erythroxylum novogranatense]